MKIVTKKAAFLLIVLLAVPMLWAQNRIALVIANADYNDTAITPLPNAINDTNDITAALRNLGFDPVLRQNLTHRDIVREIDAFIARLRSNRDSEGFFWYAGHAMEINGENYLLPLDVDLESESLIKNTSYSINELTEAFNRTPNKVNVMVLDACRVPPAIGSERSRSAGDATRALKMLPETPDLLIIYSTASGTVTLDGSGKSSPFTEAFLKYINSTEPLSIMVNHVITETRSLTGQRQIPYTSGSIGSGNAYYSLNQAGGQNPTGSITISSDIAGEIFIEGRATGYTVKEGGDVIIPNISTGMTQVAVKEADGTETKAPNRVMVVRGRKVEEVIERSVPWGLAYKINDDGRSVTITRYTGNAATVNIPASIKGLSVDVIGRQTFWDCSSLIYVTLSRLTQVVGENSFPITARIIYRD